MKLLDVQNLKISFGKKSNKKTVIHGISYHINKNEILGVVGESGSGKSVSSLAVLGLLPKRIAYVDSGEIVFKNQNVLSFSNKEFQAFRGKQVAMIFQEPMSSLNPSMVCGKQVTEVLIKHLGISYKEAKTRTIDLFNEVKLPNPELTFNKYPHEISGGQKQRVVIAIAIACEPELLIADEPTTALDVTVQKEIIKLLKELQLKTKMSILFITHDLALVSEISDRVLVMYKGQIVEEGLAQDIFLNPNHKYTQALIKSRPDTKERLKTLPTIDDFLNGGFKKEVITTFERQEKLKSIYNGNPILRVSNIEKTYLQKGFLFQSDTEYKAVNKVSFSVYEGETVGLVGESGCGKSTLANVILQLDDASSGEVFYNGLDITKLSDSELRHLRKDVQLIFQDPFSSLNPRIPVGKAIMEPMKVHDLYDSEQGRKEKALELLKRVGLDESHFYRYPHEFSGGQRQRIGIARTIAVNPKLIICDESVSALDISVQAQVLNLLNELKDNFGFSYIFISHDLSVVKYMSDSLLVMNKGILEEQGDSDEIYNNPQSEYTKTLINAIPKGI